MAGIDKLYLKYCNRVQRHLEEDPYYQYLLELIAAGKPTISQINRVLDKSVDEKWLTAIEDAIPAIHEIIAHPKRFIKTTEEIKPVEKVSKVGPATVQHLASHTQFISGMRGDSIYPGKLLAVEVEDSIDLYENRFVNTLIRKLAEFIEKRTGALFWDSGNEQSSILRMEDKVEDDYEVIEFKLDMTVHSKQTYLENDAGKLEIFKRIDRVRRVISDFRQSAFVAAMSSTGSVRSPVQRTNQIMKNQDYRKCYDLWQFLERYDQVGYAIDVRETALDFDEEYLFQMYGNLAMSYTVFKSLLEADQRRITEKPKRRKSVKPKFVKQIVEEFVDDYDLPDVEIRQVIIEEVTRAHEEIDRRAQELTAAKKEKSKENEKALLAKEREKEKERLAREKEKEKERLAKEKEREKAKLAAQKAKEKEKERLAREKAKEKERLAKEKEREREKARLAKEKEKEKERLAKQKEREREKAKLAREKERERAKIAAQKAKEKEKATALKAKNAEKEQGAPKPKAAPKAKAVAPAAKASATTAKAPAKPKAAAAKKPVTAPKPVADTKELPAETAAVAEVPAMTEAPPVETPAVAETVTAEIPVVETPAVTETPVVETPAVTETPVVETPVVETPAVEAPAIEVPVTPAVNPLTEWLKKYRKRR